MTEIKPIVEPNGVVDSILSFSLERPVIVPILSSDIEMPVFKLVKAP
tara:strand:+ start:151 stop:291 length:141 start_codon:yes stop_codon:yes gene_type:complete